MSWWITPESFAANAAKFNHDAKVLGASALPRAVRTYLDKVEEQQHREAHLLPRKREALPYGPTR